MSGQCRFWPVLLLAALAAPPAARGQTIPRDKRLHRPPVETLDERLIQEAASMALRNGIASLMARQLAPENETGLVFPPVPQRQVVEHKNVPIKHSWRIIREPVYRDEWIDELEQDRDPYGQPTGTYSKRPRLKRTQIGVKEVKRLVPDANGDVVVNRNVPVYAAGGPDMVTRGCMGLNGMALYVYCKAGLAQEATTSTLVQSLARLVDQVGMPDQTFDLAWLVAGFSQVPGDEYAELQTRLVCKLLDGQNRSGPSTSGLWGPVAIHYGVLARFFEIEVALAQELTRVTQQLEKVPLNQRAAGEAVLAKLQRVLNDVLEGLRECTQHGRRISLVTVPEVLKECNLERAPLPYYIYNRLMADVDSTAIAAFALDEAAKAQRLPKATRRVEPAGRKLLPPEPTAPSIAAALRALLKVQRANGGWDCLNALEPNLAFARSGLPDVPPPEPLHAPFVYETMRSNLNGLAGLIHLLRAGAPDEPQAATHKKALAAAEARAAGAIQAYLNSELTRYPRWASPFDKQVVPIDELAKANGQIPVEPWKDRPIEGLPYGHFGGPYEILPGAMALLRPVEGLRDRPSRTQFFEMAYRLMITQREDGQWQGPGAGAGLSSVDYACELDRAAISLTRAAVDPKARKDLDLRYYAGNHTSRVWALTPTDLYATLASLAYLLEGFGQPVDMTDAIISPSDEAMAADTDGKLSTPAGAARGVDRPNPLLGKLQLGILARLAYAATQDELDPSSQPASAPAASAPVPPVVPPASAPASAPATPPAPVPTPATAPATAPASAPAGIQNRIDEILGP